jgi:hypothetical protein
MWVMSGFYMVVVDLDFIHGDPLVRNLTTPPKLSTLTPVSAVTAKYPDIQQIRIKGLPGFEPALYEITTANGPILLDASTGAQLSPLTRERIASLANAYYAGRGELAHLELLTANPPLEIQTRPLPLWRADFNDWLETSLYIHPSTGELVTRRHRFWRWFDFFWMLHTMDYEGRDNFNNPLVITIGFAALWLALSGFLLLFKSFRRQDFAFVTGWRQK